MRTKPAKRPQRPFAIGLEKSHLDLGQGSAPSLSTTPVFLPSIMYKAVSTRLFESIVQYHATPPDISQAFSIPEPDAALFLPSNPQAVPPPHRHQSDASPVASLADGLDGVQFKDLLEETHKPSADVVQFASTLQARLWKLSPPKRKTSLERSPVSHVDAAARTACSDGDGGRERGCGFSRRRTHGGLDVLCDGLAIVKMAAGLYRNACASGRLDGKGVHYFEVVVVEDVGAGGVCVGVAGCEHRLDKLVGGGGGGGTGVGLHSSGKIVCRGEFRDFGCEFRSGDRVGCWVGVGEDGVELRYFVNGVFQGRVWEEGAGVVVPTVSLYRVGSKAVMQCCRKDWLIDEGVFGEEVPRAVCEG